MTETKMIRKKAIAKEVAKDNEPQYMMSKEVKDWIERASSIMKHQEGKIQDLQKELKELKAYKKWAEHRILRSDHEE